MDRFQLETLWSETLRSPGIEGFEKLAEIVADTYASGDRAFVNRVKDRLTDTQRQGCFDVDSAKMLIADEIGFASWNDLVAAVTEQDKSDRPLLFAYARAAMDRGDFSALERMAGGPDALDDQIVGWYEKDYFESEPEMLAEIFAAACMLGRDRAAAYLLDHGVDPLAGTKTGLNGFHYAASSGRLSVIKLLIGHKVPMEVRNMYNGTVFEQALWSAVNEHTPDHAAIIEVLIDGGAQIEPGTLDWWNMQSVPSVETKSRVAAALAAKAQTDRPI